jgi:hypothetical protein
MQRPLVCLFVTSGQEPRPQLHCCLQAYCAPCFLEVPTVAVSTSYETREIQAARGELLMGDKEYPILLPKCRLPRNIWGSFTCRKSMTWGRRLYFPSEGRCAGDFFALKNPTALARFEPANLGTRGQHASSRPPKPLIPMFTLILHLPEHNSCCFMF